MASLPQVPRIKLGSQGLEVSALGLGCMGMSSAYAAPKPEQDMIDLLHQAVDRGVTFLDTSNLYGPYTNELLLGKALKGIRNKVQLATKFAVEFDGAGGTNIRGDPPYVRSCCEESLKRLQVDYIDLYYQHRIDNKVPIEDTIIEMKKLVAEGKVKYLGLSEASASTIRRAHAVHPITAVQIEWSLWSRDVEEEIVPTCRELGIGIVPYSPLGRGFFTAGAKLLENLSSRDFRKVAQPRMQGKNLDHNNLLFESLARVAARKGCTPGQLALAWVQYQGEDVASIPGTTKLKNLEENIGALAVHLTQQETDEIEALFPPNIARGDRYLPNIRTYLQSDTPPLT